MHRGEIKLKNETLTLLHPYLVTRGVPLPPGKVKNASQVRFVDARGRVLPGEGRILQRRPDQSIEWLLADILTPLDGQQATSIFIEPRPGRQPEVKNAVRVTRRGKTLTLSNGLSEIILSPTDASLIRKLTINGRVLADADAPVDLEVIDTGGKIHRASLASGRKITITHRNRLRTEVTITGTHAARDGSTFLDYALRLTLTADNPDLKIEHTFYCREAREGIIRVRAIRLIMPTAMNGASGKLIRQLHHGHDWFHRDVEVAENVEIIAANTGDIDHYAQTFEGAKAAHPTAGGSVFLRNADSLKEDFSAMPFHMRPGQGSGFREFNSVHSSRMVAPVVGWVDREAKYTLVTAFEHFRQLHPKSIEIDESRITWSIWPAWSIPMEIVQGVSKSHIWWISGTPRALDMDAVMERLYRWEYGYVEPVDISIDPAWSAHCQVLDCHEMLSYQPDKYPLLENLIEASPAAGNPARHTYDRLPAIGMFHFGDHVSGNGASCANNEDDTAVLAPLLHYLRTGHTYAWDQGKETARHYMEADFCEWSTDPRQNGGLIPHTGNHFIGNVYPSHQWAEGLLAYYYLSGDERARKAVVACGDNNIWWAENKIEAMACDGREAGMPLVNLAAAFRLTHDEKYLDAARRICKDFFERWTAQFGEFKYPYPQGTAARPHKLITGYGDWSSFAGLYRLWEFSGQEYFRDLGVALLDKAMQPAAFSLNDIRGMDFFAAWAFGRMTGNMDEALRRVQRAVPMLLRRGGHPLRRLHFLNVLDQRDLIDDSQVGNRGGVI